MKKKTKVSHKFKLRPNIDSVYEAKFLKFYTKSKYDLVLSFHKQDLGTYVSIFYLTTPELGRLITKFIRKNDFSSVNAIMQSAIKSGRKKFCRKYNKYFYKALASIYGTRE